MNDMTNDDIMQNIKKIGDKYQEIILYFINSKSLITKASSIDGDKIRIIYNKISQQFLDHPEKFLQINFEYIQKFQQLIANSIMKSTGTNSKLQFSSGSKDKRFKDQDWEDNIYFDFIKQFYLMSSEYLQKHAMQYQLDREQKKYLLFLTRQFTDSLSPSNFICYNPQVLKECIASGWTNIVRGLDNLLEDLKKSNDILNIKMHNAGIFKLGDNIAVTKGKVIFQNQLMQLICYEPKQKTRSIPIFIVPPWINKYYILDLSPHNSMVSFLVENNFQLFMVSWINPDMNLAHKDFENYLQEGILEPCQHILKLGYQKINAVGYCIGGTLLASAIAYMKATNLNYIHSATFLTTLLDFANPGEIDVFINESSIKAIDAEMQKNGYFDGRYLSHSFSLLRANDLIWSFFINNYLLGKSPMDFDILYLNQD
jgi:polyhydroxyalkanoate synthase